jgi:hypothetical protein
MSPELNHRLCEDYSSVLHGLRIDCGDGWYALIDTACNLMLAHGTAPCVALAIKQEFGALSMQMEGGNNYTLAYVEFAEALSERICELCGRPGVLLRNPSGIAMTRCGTCDAEDGTPTA